MEIPAALSTILDPWLYFLADDPLVRLLEGAMILTGAIVIFLVFYTTRDILLRTHSFMYMFLCIVLVAILPIVGFLLYLLIRPPRTLKERELEAMLREVIGKKADKKKSPEKQSKKPKK